MNIIAHRTYMLIEFKPIPNMGIEIHKPALAMAKGMVNAPVPTIRFET